jgi:2'-5' RNA ligase
MRTFIAIDLPAEVRAALAAVQRALPEGRPVPAENLHLTLAFLGDQPDAALVELDEALSRFRLAPFEMQLEGLGSFGAPDVLWAGLRDPAPVVALQARLKAALHGAGIELERRRFRPHVTLARFPMPPDAARLAKMLARWSAFPSPPFIVEAIVLFGSTLTRTGAQHQELARYPEPPPGAG